MSGNVLVHNLLGTNNIGGDGFDGPPTVDFQTTGIAIYSASIAHMTIFDNRITTTRSASGSARPSRPTNSTTTTTRT